MTMRYAHLSPAHLREAVNRITFSETKVETGTKTGTEEKEEKPLKYIDRTEEAKIFEEKLEVPSGFEPLNRSFADCSLNHLGTAP